MNENFYDAELRKALCKEIESRQIKDVGDSTPFFEQLAKSYPADGSKIDWGRVQESFQRVEENKVIQKEEFTKFFDELISKFNLSGDLIYMGDSATDSAFIGSLACIRAALPKLLAVPQHHYFVIPDFSWCMCFTMEGGMGFGFRNLLKKI